MLEHYGTCVVNYDHYEPNFLPFADREIGIIHVDKMPTKRDGPDGTFAFAEREAAKKLGSVKAVREYMQKNQLTWHECADTHTIIAVPTRIHKTFIHLGGVSVQHSVESVQKTIHQQHGNIALYKDSPTGSLGTVVSGLPESIDYQHQAFEDTKKDLFSKKKQPHTIKSHNK